jgi:hypothetical protein
VCELCSLKLTQADSYLANWFNDKVKTAYPDAHVSWSFRNRAQQNDCVSDGKSKEPWPTSKHNFTINGLPHSLALDLFQIDDSGRAVWDEAFFRAVNEMNEKAGLPIVWGGTFKMLHDLDHFQIQIIPA